MDRRDVLKGMGVAALAVGGRLAWAESVPVAETTSGKISGLVEEGVNVFRSVPYGEDTAKTRFQPPRAVAQWKGVKECARFTTMAPQLTAARAGRPMAAERSGHPEGAGLRTSSSGVPGGPRDVGVQSEDCLNLNVWTRGLHDGKKRPVLVYFHGGAYNNGTVNNDLYDGKNLCHRGDVMVVTVNHRLNAFGYLYLGNLAREYATSGNVGQLDLTLALKWVRENAESFGGDPRRVLIFGQSGGGAKCATLMAMPIARGLFNRVMTMSGQQIEGASIEIAEGRSKTVLEKMGAGGLRGKELMQRLNGLTMEQIQEGARAVSSDWLPVVDHLVLPRDPFTPDAPKLSEYVPMILGNTHDETAVPAPPGGMTWANAPEALDRAVHQYLGPYTAAEVVTEFRKIHPEYTPEQVDEAAATAFRAWPGQRMEAEERAENPVSLPRTWVYQMNFPGAKGRAMHTIDIPFMFDNIVVDERQVGTAPEHLAAAKGLAATMSEMLITFGRSGNPNYDGMPHWPAYDLRNRSTMVWDTPAHGGAHVVNDPRGAERVFAEKAHYHQAGTPLP